ncbi:MAG: 23S rRNA (pseudouridine(1915)-N(3))-methyltransferase RlmH [Bacteroidales bacterium]|nr:23S rRNA (pseudouridine(1915)-N(3))-methyltransferase RlmH [Candidatus Sodaliphilus aphodohippi]
MRATLLVVGKTTTGYLRQGIDEYVARLSHYIQFDIQYVGDIKNTKKLSEAQQKQAEGVALLQQFDSSDFVVLLDEHGREYTSMDFAQYIQKRMNSGSKRLVFVIGGPYGFSQEVYNRANDKLSMSKMTFPHELIRLVFVEQLYRGFTILNHEPYHHV